MAWGLSYVTDVEMRNFIRVDDAADDVQIGMAIAAASRAIDKACGRQFGRDDTTSTRYYTASYSKADRRWTVRVDDLMTSVGLVVGYDSGNDQTYSSPVTAYRLFPINAAVEGRPWTSLVLNHNAPVSVGSVEHGVRITGTFGWTSVPAAIKQATLLQASRFLARRDSPYGIAGSPDVGSELRLLAKVDPDVAVAVEPYRRSWWVAS